MASNPKLKLTARDIWTMSMLQLGPLDCNQILRASQVLPKPFTQPLKVADRMRKLRDAELLNKHSWLDGRIKTSNYYVLTSKGRSLVPSTGKITRSMLRSLPIGSQRHAHKTGDVFVATTVAAKRLGMETEEHTGDKQFVAKLNESKNSPMLYPDGRGVFVAAERRTELWDEIDLGTEPVEGADLDSLEGKIRFHVANRGLRPSNKYLVRVFFLRKGRRMQNFLDLAKRHAVDNEFIFLATSIDAYISDPTPLTSNIFLDHALRKRHCIKQYHQVQQPPLAEILVNSLEEPVLV